MRNEYLENNRMQNSKVVNEVGDVSAALLTVGVLADLLPAILAFFGIIWFALRMINFYRVNVKNKNPWKFY